MSQNAAHLNAKVIVNFGVKTRILSESKKIITCLNKQKTPCVAGDDVFFSFKNDTAVIEKRLQRRNAFNHRQKTLAANIDCLHLVVATMPHYQFDLINRYLIIAHKNNFNVDIIVNKMDLCQNEKQTRADFKTYQTMGYRVFFLSALNKENNSDFSAALTGKTHLFVGQSGVGKSTLIANLIPDLALKTQALTSKNTGKNTTTYARLYPMANRAFLIDSPGIKEFELTDLNKTDIKNGFLEFKTFAKHCQFRDCQHINEPNCAVKKALENQEINIKRYDSYLGFIQDTSDV